MVNLKYYGITPHLAEDEDTEEYYQVFTEPYGDLEATVTKLFWKNRLTLVVGGKNLLNYYEKRTYGYTGDKYDRVGPQYYGRVFLIKLNIKFNN